MSETKPNRKAKTTSTESTSAIQRTFLGWDRPVLHSAVDFLEKKHLRGNEWNLNSVLLVVPGSMAGRRLELLLAERASQSNYVLRPPRILTLGELPEELYHAKLPFAEPLTQVMAWVQVLRKMPIQDLQPLLFEVPDSDYLGPWMDLGRLLASLHRELASDLLDFSDVATKLKGTAEESRWQVLSKLQRRYLDVLHEAGLWDVQSARRFALEHHEVTNTDTEIILIGTVDLNRAQREFLAAIAPNVQALVGAPTAFAEGFNEDGTLSPFFWQNLEIPIPDHVIHVRTTVSEAASELARRLALLDGQRSAIEITVGVPDSTLVPTLQETLARSQVALRYGPGVSIHHSSALKMLQVIEDYLSEQSTEAFSDAIRLPYVYHWLLQHAHPKSITGEPEEPAEESIEEPKCFLQKIDAYLSQTLLRSTIGPVYPDAAGQAEFVSVVQALDALLQPLLAGRLVLAQWGELLRSLFQDLFGSVEVDLQTEDGNLIARGCREVHSVLERLSKVPPNLDAPVRFEEAVAWIQQQLHGVLIPPLANPDAIEMIGWLDLALDDAPVLLLTGMHDGVVPESVNSDAFLPNRLRSDLGLLDNARRYARDAYVMMNLLRTREHFEIVMNRLTGDGDPVTPSRLLLALPSHRMAQRVSKLVSESLPARKSDTEERVAEWTPRPIQSNIPIPLPDPKSSLRSMAVTDFKAYNECPYRFYLKRVERRRPFDPLPLELDGGGFGDLVHHVLEGLIASPVSHSILPQDIEAWLIEEIDREARERFGVSMPPALVIQMEQAKMRLREFAKHQAEHTRQGWRMRYIEHKVEKGQGIQWQLKNGVMEIHGRIDRIDFHEETGDWAVLDYKTGNSAEEPRKNHLKRDGTWKDWQLPLYGQLISTLEIEDLSCVKFGYILLPKNSQQTQFVYADFTLAEHASAIASAKEIASDVLDGKFWPPSHQVNLEWDDCVWITQRTAMRPWVAESEQGIAASPKHEVNATDTEPMIPENEIAQEASAESTLKDDRKSSSLLTADRRNRGTDVPQFLAIKPVQAIGTPPVEWFKPTKIRASAGTGKTYQLASRAIRLLFSDQPLDSILATTFTRKGAGEILQRVLGWLAEGCETAAGLQRLREILMPLVISPATAEYQLARLCSHLHRFRVSTLDSFYTQLAKSFALELKLPPGWSLIDPAQEEQVHREAITAMFAQVEHRQLRSLISQLSKGDAVRSVWSEIESVVKEGYAFYRPGKPEVWQMRSIPSAPAPEDFDRALKALEIVSASKQIENAKGKLLLMIRNEEWEEFLVQTLVLATLDPKPTYYSKPIPDEVQAPVKVLRDYARTMMLNQRQLQTQAAYQVLDAFHVHLTSIKRARRLVSFADITKKLEEWLDETRPESDTNVSTGGSSRALQNSKVHLAKIDHRLDCSVDHLLLDEFQDTSPEQWNILKPFAKEIVNKQDRDETATSFFCVGDSKQAIYAWRGGVSEIFQSVDEQIQGIKEQHIVESRRSSPVVIDFVNRVFPALGRHTNYLSEDKNKPLDASHPVPAWIQKHFSRHSTTKGELPGFVEFRNVSVKESDGETEESPASLLLCEIAERVKELHWSSPKSTIGILTRTNKEVAEIITLLRERGVEASQEGGNPLTDTAAVLLILSAMQLANHPGDSLAHFHLLHSPLSRHWPDEVRQDPTSLSADLRERIDRRGFGGTVSELAQEIANECTQRDQVRLQQFIECAHRFDTFRRIQIQEFVEFVESVKVSIPGGSSVRVMTIHQSKGLEFDAVFLASLDHEIASSLPLFVVRKGDRVSEPIGIIRYMSRELQNYLSPGWQEAVQKAREQQFEEALCLFYVAMTRARQALYLMTSPSKNPKKTWGSALHSVFAEGNPSATPGLVFFSDGNPRWYASATDDSEMQENAPQTDAQPITSEIKSSMKLTLAPVQWTDSDGQHVAPSQLNATYSQSVAELWQQQDFAGAIIGKLVHRWFEEINGWVEDFKPQRLSLQAIAKSFLTQDEMTQLKLDDWIERFLGYCSAPGVRQALSRDRYEDWSQPNSLRLEVTTERRLLQLLDGNLVRGIIDRCVLGLEGARVVRAEILDYKTDQRRPGEDLAGWQVNRMAIHSPQLVAYRKVLCRQFGLHPNSVQMTLVFLGEDLVVAVP